MARTIIICIVLFFVVTFTLIGTGYYFYRGHFFKYIATLFVVGNDWEEAKEYFEKSARIFEEHKEESQQGNTYALMALTYRRLEDWTNSEKYSKKALSYLPQESKNYAICLWNLAIVLINQNKFAEAGDKLNELTDYYVNHLTELDATKARRINARYFLLCEDLLIAKEEAKAACLFEKVMHFNKHIHEIDEFGEFEISNLYEAYASVHGSLDRFDEAEKYYKMGLNHAEVNSPVYIDLLEGLGVVYAKQNKYQEAFACYKTAFEYYEDKQNGKGLAHIYNCVSYLHWRQGNRKESLEYGMKILEHLKDVHDVNLKAAIFDTLACAYQINQEYANAEKYMRLAIEQVDDDPDYDAKLKSSYYARLGDLLHSQSREEEARQAWAHADKLKE